jgi:Fe/S biogenesis protein NfuA
MSTNNKKLVEVSSEAVSYISDLLSQRDSKINAVCIFVENPGTPNAETCLCYFDDIDDAEENKYIKHTYAEFDVYTREKDEKYLIDAKINITKEGENTQLTVKSPNAKSNNIDENSTLEEQVKHIIEWDINPMLASHGGVVRLIKIIKNNTVVVLEFGGGCQGCSMVDSTVKEMVEKTIIKKLPSIKAIEDITDHTNTDNAYL